MTPRVLIANRGEIASRLIRACQELGFEAVAAFSDADRSARWVAQADRSVEIGPAPAAKSYLNSEAILAAANDCGATAIHPGYGFLAENSDFAAAVKDSGLIWVGPEPECIRVMGDKSSALSVAESASVPILPRSDVLVDLEAAVAQAEALGYPVLLKANAGGGGRGIRPIHGETILRNCFDQARAEVGAAFGSDSMYLEKMLTRARHVEVQVLGDMHGNVIHLFERDCSLQRRRQKVVEEAPSPSISETTRESLSAAAVRLAKAVNYNSAGTVEFLVDEEGDFYFIEMNTRIQVEHGVTELVTGIDIAREQLRVAHGERLNLSQDDVVIRGAAIEVRINAEDPEQGFIGSPGDIEAFTFPTGPGIRIDTGFGSGDTVQPFYDSLLCKILVCDRDRDAAIKRMSVALRNTAVEGVSTNVSFLQRTMQGHEFLAAEHHTTTLEQDL